MGRNGVSTYLLAALAGAALLLGACSKPTKKSAPDPAASSKVIAQEPSADLAASAANANAYASAAALAATTARAPVPRASLQSPPLAAPADAQVGPGGVRYQLLHTGSGDSPDSVDTIVVDFSMWTADGQLAFSSYPEPQPAAFSVSTLAPNLRGLLTHLKIGSQVRFWVPRAALAGWKPPDWPDTDLIFELALLNVSHVMVKDASGNAIVPIPGRAPDAAGPPKDAESTPSGLHYVYLAHSQSQKLPTADDHLDVIATAYVVDGIEVKLVNAGIKTGTTLARAPGKLAEILKRLSPGDQVRVWVPKGQGKAVIPEAGEREMILDLAVSF